MNAPEGVSPEAWSRLAHWEGDRWAIDERDASGEVIGTAYRDANGEKTFAPGGRRGLIVAWPLPTYAGTSTADPVFVCEGASDTAALLGLGLNAVGVPMAGHCGDMLGELLSGLHPVIVADADDAGRRGAAKIAAALIGRCASVRIMEPPGGAKDARAAVIAGANREVFLSLADAAEPETATPPAGADPPAARRQKGSTLLLQLVADAELFHTPEPEGYARVRVGDHSEVHRIRSRSFKLWLRGAFYAANGHVPNSEALEESLSAVEARALFGSPERPVCVRLAEHDGAYYLDLADPRWRAVRIDSIGWRIVNDPPVMFRRAKGMLPLPEPTHGGSIDTLRRFVNTGSEDDWRMMVAWLLAALRPTGPYPALALYGEQGSAKSTAARVLRRMIDPNRAPLRAAPREERDLAIAANNGWVVALDNLSGVHPWLSDALCRLATGGGFGTRTLYENDEETLFDYTRPVVLTGIEELATRPDLLDRAIPIVLPTIEESKRRTEADFWRDVEREHPAILGALLDVVSGAMGRVRSVVLPRAPRMADFATWAVAAEPALGWPPGSFLAAYEKCRAGANTTALESSPIIGPVVALADAGDWSGAPTALLSELEKRAGIDPRHPPDGWPKRSNVLTGALRRFAPNLRAVGVDVRTEPGRSRGRIVTIRRTGAQTVPIVPTVPDGPREPEAGGIAGRSEERRDDGAVPDRPSIDGVLSVANASWDDRDDQDDPARSPSDGEWVEVDP